MFSNVTTNLFILFSSYMFTNFFPSRKWKGRAGKKASAGARMTIVCCKNFFFFFCYIWVFKLLCLSSTESNAGSSDVVDLGSLPNKLLLHCFGFLQEPKALCTITCVCKRYVLSFIIFVYSLIYFFSFILQFLTKGGMRLGKMSCYGRVVLISWPLMNL